VSPPEKGEASRKRLPATTRPDLPPGILNEDADSEQLTLWPDAIYSTVDQVAGCCIWMPPGAESIPAHRLHPAEADMRRVVNTMPRRKRSWAA
jgi:hypothetical protein